MPVLFLGVLVMAGLLTLYAQVKGIPLSAVPDLNGALITIPAFILWVPLALQLGNVVLRTIPTLRAIAENYAARLSTIYLKFDVSTKTGLSSVLQGRETSIEGPRAGPRN